MHTRWWGWGSLDKNYPLEARPRFWPFLETRLGPERRAGMPVPTSIALRSSRLEIPAFAALSLRLGPEGVRTDEAARVQHTYGKSYRDLLRLRQGEVLHPPDAVVYPADHDQVVAVLDWARSAGARVIPYGGGTSVVGGVEMPAASDDRPFVVLDLARMDRLLHLDAASRLARLQAGVMGPELERHLGAQGFTLGHFPQSFEFSSLGGWIATRSAGQFSGRYGKIEDMVMALKVATPAGTLETPLVPAHAMGPDLVQWLAGSEGIYGVITEAVMRVRPVPAVRDLRGFLFASFDGAVRAIRELLGQDHHPTLVRLSDEHETEAMFKLREEPAGAGQEWLQRAGRWVATRGGRREFSGTCLLLVGFEGSVADTVTGWEAVTPLLKRHGAMSLGRSIGDAWYRGRFELPYLRDTLLDRGVMVDTLETATTWSKLMELYVAVDGALRRAIADQGTPAFVMCHVSHTYLEGASLYFTFAARQLPGKELEQWEAAKRAATEAIVQHGGALSHHHGIGQEHAPWLARSVGPLGVKSFRAVRQALDPDGLMHPGPLLPEV